MNNTPSALTAVFYEHGTPFSVQYLPVPILEKGELLVKNEYTTLCRSDLLTWSGKRIEKSPTILGHEVVGRIVAFGPDTAITDLRGVALATGDRISWAIYAGDPAGEMARRGMPQKAPDLYKYGHEQISAEKTLHGGLSEYILLKRHTPVVKIDEAMPLPVAAVINCSVATVAGALRLAGDVQGKHVLVTGAGMLGLVACAMCSTRSAASVSVLDLDQARLETSLLYGVDHTFLADEHFLENLRRVYGHKHPIDIVIEVSGAISAMEQSLESLGIGGTAVWVGATFPQPAVSVNAEQVVRRLLTIKGLHNYHAGDFLEAVVFMEQYHDQFPFLSMVYDGFSLPEIDKAFEYAVAKKPFRVGIRL